MTDYLGNEIKAGDEICFITVIDRCMVSKVGFFIPSTGESQEVDMSRPDKPSFKKSKYYKMFEWHGQLAYTVKGVGYTMTDTLPPLWFDNQTQIIAIKGISDSKEQYLKFKNK